MKSTIYRAICYASYDDIAFVLEFCYSSLLQDADVDLETSKGNESNEIKKFPDGRRYSMTQTRPKWWIFKIYKPFFKSGLRWPRSNSSLVKLRHIKVSYKSSSYMPCVRLKLRAHNLLKYLIISSELENHSTPVSILVEMSSLHWWRGRIHLNHVRGVH